MVVNGIVILLHKCIHVAVAIKTLKKKKDRYNFESFELLCNPHHIRSVLYHPATIRKATRYTKLSQCNLSVFDQSACLDRIATNFPLKKKPHKDNSFILE